MDLRGGIDCSLRICSDCADPGLCDEGVQGMVPKSLTRYAEGLSVEAAGRIQPTSDHSGPFRYCSTAASLPLVPAPPEAERIKMIHRPDLLDSEFGAILSGEQTDVRHVLLADSPVAPIPGARTSLQTGNTFSLDSFFFSLTEN